MGRKNGNRRTAGHYSLQLSPSSNSAPIFIGENKFCEGKTKFNFIHAGLINMSASRNQFGAFAVSDADFGILRSAHIDDVRNGSNAFHIIPRSRPSPQARNRRKRRLNSWVAALPFQRLNQGGFFAADV